MVRKKGFKHSKKTKERIGLANSIALKGRHPKTEFKKGNIPWNKNKKLPYIPHIKKRGQIPWNKGKSSKIKFKCIECGKIFYSYEERKYCSRKCMFKNKIFKGGFQKGHKDFVREESRKRMKGKKNPKHSKKLIEFWKNNPKVKKQISKTLKKKYKENPEMRENLRKKRYEQKRVYESKPEKIFQQELKKRNIKFKKHKYIKIQYAYQCDIFIKPNIIIEIDGDYWHSQPNNKIKDEIRNKELIASGYKIFRILTSSFLEKNYNIKHQFLNKFFKKLENETE